MPALAMTASTAAMPLTMSIRFIVLFLTGLGSPRPPRAQSPSPLTLLRALDQFDCLLSRVDANSVAGPDQLVGVARPALGDGDVGEYRALHHHRVGDAEYESLGRDPLGLDVVERPARGDAALGARRDQDLVLQAVAFERVSRARDEAAPAV